jgi:hypothetical protein
MPQNDQLVLTSPEPMEIAETEHISPSKLLSLALQNKASIDVIERVAALVEKAEERSAEIAFNDELNLCQKEVELVVVDSDKTGPGGKKWATYKALNKAIRPIYTGHGFSLSFGTADCSIPEQILVTCLVSRGLHTRLYQLPMDASGKGAKGGDALTKPHAILAAMEYGRRCLLKSIFNIVTGDEDTLTEVLSNGELVEHLEWIANSKDLPELKKMFTQAWNKFEASDPVALKAIVAANKKRREELS